MNGLYLQLHAYMLRVAIPYGVLNSAQLSRLADVSRRFDKSYGHFTTRTNIQFHWIRLKDAPDILETLAEVGLHAVQTSGNCIRNTTTDPFAGAVHGEADDPRVWCEVIRQWSTFHPEFTYLPRKFKIAVTASAQDRAVIRGHDIGLRLFRREGELFFEVMTGGGMGRTPYLGPTIREALPAGRLVSYLAAILRVYNRLGRRDNLYKARIKILVAALGRDAFAAEVEQEWSALEAERYDVPDEEIGRIRQAFAATPFREDVDTTAYEARRRRDPAFSRFARRNIIPHRQPGYGVVNIALKAPGEVPGDCSADQMDVVAELARVYAFDEVRVTHAQNLVLPHVALDVAGEVYDRLAAAGLATANLDLISDIIACPGLDYCALANARAIPIAQQIAERFADPDVAEAVGELKVKISGCINACGHHHVGHIGILGVDKKGEEFYQISLGGSGAEDASLAAILGPAVPADAVAQAVETLVDVYRRTRGSGERFLDTYRRLGPAPFKEAVYADAD
jgi:sulfite reductase (NADPH) hemoprotein beta-component